VRGAVDLVGEAHHERAERLGQHVHFDELQLDDLLLVERFPAFHARFREGHARFARVVADPERVGCKLEIVEFSAAFAARFVGAVHFA
jgi:hypothetical protein